MCVYRTRSQCDKCTCFIKQHDTTTATIYPLYKSCSHDSDICAIKIHKYVNTVDDSLLVASNNSIANRMVVIKMLAIIGYAQSTCIVNLISEQLLVSSTVYMYYC